MKRSIQWLMTLLAAVLSGVATVSCTQKAELSTKDDPSQAAVMTLNSASLNFAWNASTGQAVTVSLDNISGNWSASSDQAWAHVTPTSGANGSAFTVTCDNNTGAAQRTATITVSAGGESKTVAVTQDGAVSIAVAPGSLNFAWDAFTGQAVVVTLNNIPGNWTALSDQAWATISPSSGAGGTAFAVTCSNNAGSSQRTATITVSAGGMSKSVTVTQDGQISIAVSSSSLNFTWNASAGQPVTVTLSNIPGNWTASSDSAWTNLSPVSGANGSAFTVVCDNNNTSSSRTATITVNAGGMTKTITVTQDGEASIAVTPPTMNFTWNASAGQSATVTLANIPGNWTASSDSAWANLSSASGTNGSAFTVFCANNNSVALRTATITVNAGGVTKTVTVTQEGMPSLTVTPADLNFIWNPTSGQPVVVTLNNIPGNWSASSNSAWATVSPSSGADGATFTVTCLNNVSTAQRMAIITVSAGGVTKSVTVTQDGQASIAVSPSSLNFVWNALTGQSVTVTLNNIPGNWTASSNQSWVTVSPSSGAGGATFTVTCSNNATTVQRTAVITVTAGSGYNQSVSVTQNGEGGAPRISVSGSGVNAKLVITTDVTDGGLIFKFGSVVGVFSGPGRVLSLPADNYELGIFTNFNVARDIAFNPIADPAALTTWGGLVNNYTLPSVPGYSDRNLDPSSDAYQGITNLSDNVYHNLANVKQGKGDPCRLIGMTANEIRGFTSDAQLYAREAALKTSGEGGWRLPTNIENQAFVGSDGPRTNHWTTLNGVLGGMFPDVVSGSPATFLPAAGWRVGVDPGNPGALYYPGFCGEYWSSSYAPGCRVLTFERGNVIGNDYNDSVNGFSVRCVPN